MQHMCFFRCSLQQYRRLDEGNIRTVHIARMVNSDLRLTDLAVLGVELTTHEQWGLA
jgi:hypothetical protein